MQQVSAVAPYIVKPPVRKVEACVTNLKAPRRVK